MRGRGLRALALACVVVGVVPAAAWAGTGPSVAGSVQSATDLSAAISVAVSGHYAYTTAYHAGELTAVDISTPGTPSIAGHSSPFLDANLIGGSNVAISGGYAFVVSKNRNASSTSNDDGNGNSLTILDIHTDPANPAVVGTVRSTSRLFGAYGVAVSGHYAYVADQGVLSGQPTSPDTSTGGFSVIDFSTPGNPTIVANIDNGSLPAPWTGQNLFDHSTSVAISGNYAYVTAFYSNRFTTIDISNPASPQIVASVQDNTNLSFPVDVAVQGNYAYVANQVGGSSPELTVLDISNPVAPTVVGTPLSNAALNGAYRIRVRGDFAYLADSSADTIAAIDISQPTAPRLAAFVYDPARLNKTTGLDLDPSGAYVVASSPYLSSESANIHSTPPYPLQTGGPTATGTISVIQLDPNPIAATIAAGSEPANPTTSTSANFTFSVNDSVSAVQCSLDGAAYGPCTTPTTQQYVGLAPGAHTFTVQATDSAGNVSVQAYSWSIDAAPASGSPPSVSGQATVGAPLTASAGTWSGYPAPTYAYQWQRCDISGANCGAIAGATAATYTAGAADAGHRLVVIVTATNSSGSASSTSSATAPITAAPASGSLPSIAGAASVGNTLQANNGTWSGYPAPQLSDTWLRCSASGAACVAIAGATSSSYTVSAADIGHTLRVAAHASNSAGSATSESPASAVVPPGVSGSLPGAGSGAPRLKLTVTAGGQGAVLSQISVSLPVGLTFAGQRAVLRALSVRDGSGHRLAYKAALRGGALVITLRKPTGALTLALSSSGLHESAALETKVRRHRVSQLSLPLVVKTRSGHVTHETAVIRPS